MAQKILIVDDDLELCDMLRLHLEQAGFEVVLASNGREALYMARYQKPDLIILDLMMPQMNGYEFMRLYGKEANMPVIILTGHKIKESDKVIGLELGADDYVTKPFGMRELIGRVQAVLRRTQRQTQSPIVLQVADITLDFACHVVQVSERLVDLTPSEFYLLATLMSAPGHPFSRLDLLKRITDNAHERYERIIDVHVRHLRTKIEPDPKNPCYIETVYGIGYRFAV